jgi:ubiquinone/menaquinone biosynthesis C-methylase UbiE
MRRAIKEFVRIVATTLPVTGPVYEFGSYQVETQEGFADLRPFFPGMKYIGTDMREGPGVDIVLNLHDLDLPADTVGTALCLETLEHVEYPHKALEQIHRVLQPDGIVVISSTMFFPIHDFPYDYWRFTPEAFRSLLKPYKQSFVGFAGDQTFPHTLVGIGFKGTVPDLSQLEKKYQEWAFPQNPDNIGLLRKAYRQITPPILYKAFSHLRENATRKITKERN